MEHKSSQIVRVVSISLIVGPGDDFEVFSSEVLKKFSLDISQLFQNNNESLNIYLENKKIEAESENENNLEKNESNSGLVFCNNRERLQTFATKIANLLSSKTCKFKNRHNISGAIVLNFEKTQVLNAR